MVLPSVASSTKELRGKIGRRAHRLRSQTAEPESTLELLMSMNKLQFKGSWNEVKGKLKQKYGQLTDNDLTFAEGKDEELLGRLQTRLGKSKEALRKEIEEM